MKNITEVRVTKWVCSNGVEFSTLEAAEEFEAALDMRNCVQKVYAPDACRIDDALEILHLLSMDTLRWAMNRAMGRADALVETA